MQENEQERYYKWTVQTKKLLDKVLRWKRLFFFRSLITAHQGSTFGVLETNSASSGLDKEAIGCLDHPNEGKNGKGKSGPVNEARGTLTGKDGEKGEANCNGSREVTFGGGESIGGSCSFEEEQGKEDQNFGPDTSLLSDRIVTESFKGSEDDENSSPSVVQRERKVDEEFVSDRLRRVMLLDNVVNVGYCGGYEKGENKGGDITAMSPEVDVDGIENTEERESPGNSVDDNSFSIGEELVDDGAEEEKVNNGPNQESPGSRSNISFFASVVDVGRGSYGVNVGT